MRYFTLLTFAAAAVTAQLADQSYDSSLDMTIDSNSIEASQKATWCRAQTDTCDTLCDDDVSANNCDYTTIEYECKCASNDSTPGLQWYTQSMPTFICETLTDRCITENVRNQTGQTACRENIQSECGTLDPNDADVGGSTNDEDEDEDEDDDDDDSEDSEESSTTANPTASSTGSDDEEEEAAATNTDDADQGDFAAATAAPVLAALGIFAALF
ncbi:uncharacterized protein J7T54_006311 [Emericellopsis cladophorae]|uniref:DUF7707 domain-containing protein n=1 Tax=Emericellopsis cladophorae TaxID=2686198 RepID=A0A9Q0BHE2_9HYPO|nr:uncharacterized protein J7T54_006311 [Emericellopsis cladophorae]KAI6785972.1 hypothetical protein J7T54_006311 [Emericellopsis cladophorae]